MGWLATTMQLLCFGWLSEQSRLGKKSALIRIMNEVKNAGSSRSTSLILFNFLFLHVHLHSWDQTSSKEGLFSLNKKTSNKKINWEFFVLGRKGCQKLRLPDWKQSFKCYQKSNRKLFVTYESYNFLWNVKMNISSGKNKQATSMPSIEVQVST